MSALRIQKYRYIEMVVASILGILAIVLTVLRSWPQYLRIVIKKESAGVSHFTWIISVANHLCWLIYALLSDLPVIAVVNLLTGIGCALIVAVLRSWIVVVGVGAICVPLSLLTYFVADAALLTLVTFTALAMFVPQLIRIFRSTTQGVSLATWSLAVGASATWIAYGWTIHRLSVVVAHFFMLPAASIIVIRILLTNRSGAMELQRKSRAEVARS